MVCTSFMLASTLACKVTTRGAFRSTPVSMIEIIDVFNVELDLLDLLRSIWCDDRQVMNFLDVVDGKSRQLALQARIRAKTPKQFEFHQHHRDVSDATKLTAILPPRWHFRSPKRHAPLGSSIAELRPIIYVSFARHWTPCWLQLGNVQRPS